MLILPMRRLNEESPFIACRDFSFAQGPHRARPALVHGWTVPGVREFPLLRGSVDIALMKKIAEPLLETGFGRAPNNGTLRDRFIDAVGGGYGVPKRIRLRPRPFSAQQHRLASSCYPLSPENGSAIFRSAIRTSADEFLLDDQIAKSVYRSTSHR